MDEFQIADLVVNQLLTCDDNIYKHAVIDKAVSAKKNKLKGWKIIEQKRSTICSLQDK
jgi:hypothetical protein